MSYLRHSILRAIVLSLFLFPVSLLSDTIDTLELSRHLKSKNPVERLNALYGLSRFYFRIDVSRSLELTKRLLELASREGNREYQNRANLRLGYIYLNIQQFDSSIYYLKRAVNGTKLTGDRRRLCLAYSHLGQLYFNRDDRPESIKYFKIAAATDSTYNPELTDVYNKMGIIYGDAGNITRSMEFFNKALQICRATHDSVQMGYIYTNIGNIFDRIGNNDKCNEFNEKALDLFLKTKNLHGQGYIYNGMGITASRMGDNKKALEYLKLALDIQTRERDFQKVSFTLTNMGDILLKINKPDSGLHCYLKSLGFSEKSNDKLSMSCTYLSLGRYYFDRSNFAKALDYAGRTLQLSKEINYRENLEAIYQFLSEIYEKTSRPKESLACLQKRNALRDSTLHVKAQHAVTEMMIKYETGEKKEEISKLNREVDEKNSSIRNMVLIATGIFLAIPLLFICIYYYYRKRLKPKVASMDLIMDKVSAMKGSDSRRMKSLKKILPPDLGETVMTRENETPVHQPMIDDLERMMKEGRLFLDEDLSLAEVARRLKSNTSYLSRLINDHYQMNFNSFINRYRVEEAKELIRNHHQETLSFEGIARNAGFRSRSSFNQSFKACTGMTPSQFAQKVNKSQL